MFWTNIITILSIITLSYCINRPVYKIVLTQKGFSQFIQYDIDTPPIREFTFCTWIRLYDLDNEQGLFSYVVNGNRVIRLWLDSGGHFLKVAINEKTPSMISIEIVRDVWRHICLSYQSDYGAWALYIDGRLISCESLQSLNGFVLPGGGSIIIGYGTSNAIPSGIEGEVFGANMILSSTIERNHTLKRDPLYEQKKFLQNRVFGNRNLKYIILGELESKVIKNNFETSKIPPVPKKNKYPFSLFPYSFTEHGNYLLTTSLYKSNISYSSTERDIDFVITEEMGTTEKINFWNLVNRARNEIKNKDDFKISSEGVKNKTATFTTWNTLSPSEPKNINSKSLKPKSPTGRSFYAINQDMDNLVDKEIEIQPDLKIKNSSHSTKYLAEYNQRSNSKLAGNVLNYLKRINFYVKEPIKVPVNVPLVKIPDNFENLREFKGNKVRQPLKFQRRNFVSTHLNKREIKKIQTSAEIKEDTVIKYSDFNKLNPALETVMRKNVTTKSNDDQRFHRNANRLPSKERSYNEEIDNLRSFTLQSANRHNTKSHTNSDENKKKYQLTILPFIKSIEYYNNKKANNSNEVYNTDIVNDLITRSLLQGNKWHNVQTYNNDYTPRRVNMESGILQKNSDLSEVNKNFPSIRLKYKHDFHKFLTGHKDASIIEGRALAKEVSNQSNHDTFSILKYNRGFLPKQRRDQKLSGKTNRVLKNNLKQSSENSKSSVVTNVIPSNGFKDPRLFNEDSSKRRLPGEVFKVPDMSRPKTEVDRTIEKTSASHGLKVCTTLQLQDHNLYVQPDGSVDLTSIVSPVKDKNIGIEFIMQNYKRCSLKDSNLERNSLLFIDWNKTPVRLFGGAYPKKTTDLCGFF
ncbi:protein PFF0380w-like [Battus philenor]|uniref:protein PFF0380w-like n=1 Tax=Battus philenor TaxID=42288 RepID=UPI0035CF9C02